MIHGMFKLFVFSIITLVMGGCATSSKTAASSGTHNLLNNPVKNLTAEIKTANRLVETKTANKGAPVPKAAFSSETDGNLPEHVFDNDLKTRWSSKGKSAWIVLDYGQIYEFDAVRLAFYKGNERSSRFMIQLSLDGVVWTDAVTNAMSSGKTQKYERYSFKPIRARYIKYVGSGNTKNSWNSVTEISAVNCKEYKCVASELYK